MKKLPLAALVAFLCLVIACKDNTAGKESNASQSAANAHKESNAKIYRAIETGDVSALDSVLATDAVDHGDPSGHDVNGKDSIKASLAQVHNMFSNLKMEVMNSAADGDLLMEKVRMTGTCNMDMPSMGMTKGKNMDMTTIEVTRYENGKAKEHWTYIDPKEMMQMAPPMDHKGPATDSAHKK